jgi:2-hydroxychromene-2-carboxylate isomerase
MSFIIHEDDDHPSFRPGRAPMSKPVDFYFDYVSPYSYLANTQLKKLGLTIRHKPISILEVMAKVGNQPSPKCPPKLANTMRDIVRWGRRYGVPVQLNQAWWDAFASGALSLRVHMRGAIAAERMGHFDAYHRTVFDAIWGVPRPVGSPAETAALLDSVGLPGARIFELAETADVERELDQNNEAAAQAGVFGVPTFIVDGEFFFGGDRLDFVTEYATGDSARAAA